MPTSAWTAGRLRDLLGVRYPIVQGPFGGGPSSVELVAAVSNAGGLGSFGAHVVPPEGLGPLVADLRRHTVGPFAVNLWVPQPEEQTARFTEAQLAEHVARLRPYLRELGLPDPDLAAVLGPAPSPDFNAQAEALLAARPPVISFVMGVPPEPVLVQARRLGIVTFGTATTVAEALALQAAGLDAVVASGSDAGGHRGAFLRPVHESLVGTFSLVPQVADAVAVPVIAAGGIADARGIAAALTLGADGVQIGTAFLATDESNASTVHKAALHGPEARTTVLTRVFTGRLARGIPNRLVRDLAPFEGDLPPYPVQHILTQALRRAANQQGRADYVNLWAGQAAALTTPRPAAQLFDELVGGTERLLRGADHRRR